jgi:zinc-ribbon domain
MSEGSRPQQRYCTNCGAEVRPGNAFCFSCGAPLTTGAHQSGPPHPEPTPSEEPSPFDKLMTWLRQAADRLGGSFSGLSTDGARRLPARAVEWFRDLPGIAKLIIVGLVLLVLLILLSPVAVIVAALLLGVSIIALIIRAAQKRSIKNWGIVAVTSVVLMFTFGATSDALYGVGFLGSSGSDSGRGGGGGAPPGQDGGGEKGTDTPSAGGGGTSSPSTSPPAVSSVSPPAVDVGDDISVTGEVSSQLDQITYEGVLVGVQTLDVEGTRIMILVDSQKGVIWLGLPGHRVRVHGEYQGFISVSGGGSYEAVMADAVERLD